MVILDRVDYVNKVESLLLDASKFIKKLHTEMLDLYLNRQNKLIRFLRDTLLMKKIIKENVYNSLYHNGSSPGVCMASQRFTSRTVQLAPSYQPPGGATSL